MHRRKPTKRRVTQRRDANVAGGTTLRIVGGRFRGQRLKFSGDPRTRPMKDRVRQAMFDLLGPSVRDTRAIDLFGGTGAIGLEAISRGAVSATIIERHFPTARMIQSNAASLGVGDQTEVVTADAFLWVKMTSHSPSPPWTVFCSPPYQFYRDRAGDLVEMIQILLDTAPPKSSFVVESDTQFDMNQLPSAPHWTIRDYAPARLGVCREHSGRGGS
jgi:16S rRNA (guanine(966)-N(2))-methyltransferase RsmD